MRGRSTMISSIARCILHLLSTVLQMPLKLYLPLFPILFIFSVPLLLLSAVTFALSAAILSFRVFIVYAGIALAVAQSRLLNGKGTSSLTTAPPSNGQSLADSSSAADHGLATLYEDLDAQGGVSTNRDFEGVGGWKVELPTEDDAAWSPHTPYSGPPSPSRHHKRSNTSSLIPKSPGLPLSPVQLTKVRSEPSAFGARGEYFDFNSLPDQARSHREEANTSRARSRNRRKSSSSSGSGVSFQGLTLRSSKD